MCCDFFRNSCRAETGTRMCRERFVWQNGAMSLLPDKAPWFTACFFTLLTPLVSCEEPFLFLSNLCCVCVANALALSLKTLNMRRWRSYIHFFPSGVEGREWSEAIALLEVSSIIELFQCLCRKYTVFSQWTLHWSPSLKGWNNDWRAKMGEGELLKRKIRFKFNLVEMVCSGTLLWVLRALTSAW